MPKQGIDAGLGLLGGFGKGFYKFVALAAYSTMVNFPTEIFYSALVKFYSFDAYIDFIYVPAIAFCAFVFSGFSVVSGAGGWRGVCSGGLGGGGGCE
jgi:uncharacterized membrane protein